MTRRNQAAAPWPLNNTSHQPRCAYGYNANEDKTDEARPEIKLPDERNGLLMVFRTFEKLSYALVLEITDSVKVGDRLVNPR